MSSLWLALLTSISLAGGSWFKSVILQRPVRKAQQVPDWFSREMDGAWKKCSLYFLSEVMIRRERLHQKLRTEVRKLPRGSVDFPEIEDAETSVVGTYDKLPEVLVDQGTGALFPMPLAAPERVSWFQMAQFGAGVLRSVPALEGQLETWTKFSESERIRNFSRISASWDRMNSELIEMTRRIRYLETWVPSLITQWVEAKSEGHPPESEALVKAIQLNDPQLFEELREALRPRRVMTRSFLADSLEDFPGGIIPLPIVTDIHSPAFIAEVEGAVITHWNQSPWAKTHSVSLHIQWFQIPRDEPFAAGRITLREHLAKFPQDRAAMTTGALTTQVRGSAMILGPGKITPRTLAHELGHLLGFGDCYLRTLSGQGIFGLAVLEWDNPAFPDDLMCDNSVGVLRDEAW